MKMVKFAAIALAGAMALTGCASKSAEAGNDKTIVNFDDMPAWIGNATVENGIGVVGIAKYSRHGMRIMMPKAEMDGRAKLAAEIQTEVSRLTKGAMRQANINDLDDYEEQMTEATVNLVKKIPLSGAQVIARYQEPKNGDLYIHMVIQKREIGGFIADNAKSVRAQMAEAKMTRERLDSAMNVMDNLVNELNAETSK